MAKLPVWKNGAPLWIDNGFGVLVPAWAEDPCACCGDPCDCDPWNGVSDFSTPTGHTIEITEDCNGCVPSGIYTLFIRSLGSNPCFATCGKMFAGDHTDGFHNLQADIGHDTSTGITCIAIYCPGFAPQWYEEFSDSNGDIYCGRTGASVTANAPCTDPALWN